jgi:hypothetical protein
MQRQSQAKQEGWVLSIRLEFCVDHLNDETASLLRAWNKTEPDRRL